MLEIAKQAALLAWEEVMKIYEWEFDIEIKSDNSPITNADTAANKILISHLTKTWYPILSEEKKDNLDRLKSEYLWVIDPIDGTKDFINKTWEFSIMIWLIKWSKPILWVVYAPATWKLYFAEKWKWSFLEHGGKIKKLQVQESNTILVSRNHTSQIEFQVIEELWLSPVPCGSIGVKFWLIAEWQAGSYLNLSDKLKQWDSCGPELILKEAGWKVSDTLWQEIIYNSPELALKTGCIWTNSINHDAILQFIK